MNIIWLGHSCFVAESAGWRVVLDPYYVETYPALHIEADEALCSHGHRDHAFLEAVTLSGRDKSESPFTVETVSTFHDDKKGSLRGENAIHILRAEGMTVVHCGDRCAADSRWRVLYDRREDGKKGRGRDRAARARADALPLRRARLP